MRFVVIGAGDVGLSLCSKLISSHHDVVLVEKSEARIQKLGPSLSVPVIIGNGVSPDVLVRAGLNEADCLVAVSESDEVNIAACWVSKLLNPRVKRVARLRDVSLVHRDIAPEHLSEYFDLVINPDVAGAEYLLSLLRYPGAREVLDFAQGRLRILGLSVTERSPLVERELFSLKELQSDFSFLVVAIIRNNRLIVPRGSSRIRAGDTIYIVTVPERTDSLFELAGRHLSGGRNVMIWGDQGLALHLAKALEVQGASVKLIAHDRKIAEELATQLPRTLVLVGEGTDTELLTQERVAEVDAFVAVSGDEESNILAALLAKRLGTSTTLALVNKSEYLPLVSAIGIDVVVSSRLAAAISIFSHMQPGSVVADFTLRGFGAGFLEVEVTEACRFLNVPIKDAGLPEGVLVAAIVNGDSVVIPGGNDTVSAGDLLVLFVQESELRKVEKLIGQKIELFG